MILNHWFVTDYFDRVVIACFVEPDLNRLNWLLQITDKPTLRRLLTEEMPEGWEFHYPGCKIIRRPYYLSFFFRFDIHNELMITEEFFRQVLGEYLAEWQKLDDYFNKKPSS